MGRGPITAVNYLFSNTGSGSPITAFPFTIAAWVYWNTTSAADAVFSFCDSTLGTAINALYVNATVWIERFNDVNDTTGTARPSGSAWHHVTWSCTNATSRFIRVDGVSTNRTNSRSIGAGPDRWAPGFFCSVTPGFAGDSQFAEIGIWDVALSTSEADNLYSDKYAPTLVRNSDLVAYCSMLETTGDCADDIGSYDLEESGTVASVSHPSGIVYSLGVDIPLATTHLHRMMAE